MMAMGAVQPITLNFTIN